MAKTYVGEKYVPSIEGEWSTLKNYDRLSIVTVTDTATSAINTYISRAPVTAGTPVTNVDYWALMYISRLGSTVEVNWQDIQNKPDMFPPEAHEQGWDTITGKPVTFPPSTHNQAISTVNGLQTTLTDLQEQIDGIGPSGDLISRMSDKVVTTSYDVTYTETKWKGGYMEYDINIYRSSHSVASAEGSIFVNATSFLPEGAFAYPTPFLENPVVVCNVAPTVGWGWAVQKYPAAVNRKTHLPTIDLLAATSRNFVNGVNLQMQVKGWF